MKYQKPLIITFALAQATGTGCGSSASSGLSSVSLNNIPSASSMVSSATSNDVYQASSSGSKSLVDFNNSGNLAVSGTPYQLTLIGAPSTTTGYVTVDTAFWNGLVAQLKAAGTITTAQANAFFGITSGGPGGQGACMMAQSVVESVGRILSSANSSCFMKNIPTAASGVTITSGSIAQASLFDQASADKLVKLTATMGGQSQDVFVKVYGKNTTGSSGYKAQLYFCQSGAVQGAETITVDKTAGTYSFVHDDNFSGNVGRQTLSAKLVQSGSNLAFDNTSARTADVYFSGTWNGNSNIFKGNISVSSGQITSKRYNSNTFNGVSNSDKNYSIASISGTDMSSLKFLEGGFKGINSYGANVGTYHGGVQFQNTYYVSTPTSTLATTVGNYSIAGDTFYSDTSFTPNTFSGLSCTATPDATVSLDMTAAGMQAVQTKCNGDQIDNNLWMMCYNSDIQNVMNKIWTQAPPQSN